jgi:DNA polymerase elongation subunit (family B)
MEADLEALKLALQHLKFNKHEVILFHVGDDETEAEFNFSKKPHIFIDSETGEEVKLNPASIREAYVEKMNQHKSMLKTICMQFKIDYVEAFVNQNFEQVLFPFLKKRAKLI